MKNHKHLSPSYYISRVTLILLLVTTFFPFLMMFNMSVKPTVLIATDFLSIPTEPYWTNFQKAFEFVKQPIMNSLYICGVSLLGILVNVTLSGYAFSKMKFKGKKMLFSIIMAVMMVPTTITIVPQYLIMEKLKLVNSYWSLILPYIGSQQVFGIILAKTNFDQMPQELFDAAKIDGAGEIQALWYIGLPLLKPTLITVGITAVVAMYNDYIWPTIVLTGGDEMKTFCQVVYNNAQGFVRTDIGLLTAAFILGTIPLMIITCSCLKYYLEGMVAGAVKG